MPTITVLTGFILMALGATGFVLTGSQHPTALIPAGFGIALAICGFVGKAPERRKLYMHIAVTLGLLGFLGTISGLVKALKMLSGENVARPEAVQAQAAMAIVCAIFVGLCVNSFIQARKARA
jgi:hypothetical protein